MYVTSQNLHITRLYHMLTLSGGVPPLEYHQGSHWAPVSVATPGREVGTVRQHHYTQPPLQLFLELLYTCSCSFP